jgi:hypothetical protein
LSLSRLVCLLAVAFVLGAIGTSRDASAGAALVVSVGEPSGETARLLSPLLDELDHVPMYASPASVLARLDAQVPRSGLGDPHLQVTDLMQLYEAGCQMFKKNNWKAAAEKLAEAFEKAQANSMLLVDRAHHDTWMEGLVALAMSRLRQNDLKGSEDANEELVRSFPDHEAAIRAAYGTEAARHYAAARSSLGAQGRGTLIVDVNATPAAVIATTSTPLRRLATSASRQGSRWERSPRICSCAMRAGRGLPSSRSRARARAR